MSRNDLLDFDTVHCKSFVHFSVLYVCIYTFIQPYLANLVRMFKYSNNHIFQTFEVFFVQQNAMETTAIGSFSAGTVSIVTANCSAQGFIFNKEAVQIEMLEPVGLIKKCSIFKWSSEQKTTRFEHLPYKTVSN